MEKENVKKTCFVIMPISDAVGYDEGHFTRVYELIIKPACQNAGFKPSRADDTKTTDVIMMDILKQLIEADMAICDISSRNVNVFYELGLRQAFNKKVVIIKDEKTAIPFDTASIRTLTYKSNLRGDLIKKSIEEIAQTLKETDNSENINSLVNLLSLKKLTPPNVSTEIKDQLKELRDRMTNSFISYATLNRTVYLNYKIGDIVSYFRGYEDNGKYKREIGIGKILEYLGCDHFLISNNSNNMEERIDIKSIIRTL